MNALSKTNIIKMATIALLSSFCLILIDSTPLISLLVEKMTSLVFILPELFSHNLALGLFVTYSCVAMAGFILWTCPLSFVYWLSLIGEMNRMDRLRTEARMHEDIPDITVVIPAYNEEKTVIQTIYACRKQTWKPKKIVIIDDGSTDETAKLIVKEFNLELVPPMGFRFRLPQKGEVRDTYTNGNDITLISKENAGKSYALNLGFEFAKTKYACIFDADTVVHPEGVMMLVYPMVKNENLAITSGINHMISGCEVYGGEIKKVGLPSNPLVLAQAAEFFFDMGIKGFRNTLNAQTVLVGNFSCYKTDVVMDLNGFAERGLTEDYDYNLDVHRLKMKGRKIDILSILTATGWTQGPFTLKGLLNQRSRWYGGILDSTIRQRDITFNKSAGAIGTMLIPMKWYKTAMFPLYMFMKMFEIPLLIYFWHLSELGSYVIGTILLFYYLPAFLYKAVLETGIFIGLDIIFIKSYVDKKNYVKLALLNVFFGLIYELILMSCAAWGYWKVFKKSSDWGKSDRITISPL